MINPPLYCKLPRLGFDFKLHENERQAFITNLSCSDIELVHQEYGVKTAEHLQRGFRDLTTAPIIDSYGVRQLYQCISVVRCARHNTLQRAHRQKLEGRLAK